MLNATTHGLGLLLSILGTPALVRRASAASAPGDGSHGVLAAVLYCFSLCLLYLSSTAYHSGFRLTRAQRVLLQARGCIPLPLHQRCRCAAAMPPPGLHRRGQSAQPSILPPARSLADVSAPCSDPNIERLNVRTSNAQVMDHSAIFALIAGTYTPFLLVVARNIVAAVGMWTFAVTGMTVAVVGDKARTGAGLVSLLFTA